MVQSIRLLPLIIDSKKATIDAKYASIDVALKH
jgi:hypothetical protein